MSDVAGGTDVGAGEAANSPIGDSSSVDASVDASAVKQLLSPQGRGASLRQCSWRRATVTVVWGLCLFAALGYGGQLYSAVRRPFSVGVSGVDFNYRSVGEVLADWNSRTISPGARSALLVVVVVLFISSVIAWAYLPLVYRKGPVGAALRQSFLCVAVGWPLAVLGIIAIFVLDSPPVRTAVRSALNVRDADMPTVAVVPAICAGLAFWLTRVFRGFVSDSTAPAERICEGCSYNLAHREPDERCPECGARVGDSTLGEVRVGVPYEIGGGTWLETCSDVLLRPAEFYRRLRVHGSTAAADRFVRVNLLSLGVVAFFYFGLAAQLMIFMHGNGPDDLVWFLVCGALSTASVCWAGWRVFSGMVSSAWLLRKCVPDFAHVRKVLAYESAYLWVFCATWAMLLVTFIVFDDWVTKLGIPRVARGPFRGMPPEPLLVLTITAVLAAIWWWRMERAMRRVRWANL